MVVVVVVAPPPPPGSANIHKVISTKLPSRLRRADAEDTFLTNIVNILGYYNFYIDIYQMFCRYWLTDPQYCFVYFQR